MKRFLTVLVAVLAIALLASCAAPTATPTPTTAPQATATPTLAPGKVAFVMMGLNNPFFVALSEAFKAGFEAQGWTADVTSGEFNPQTQIAAVENYIAQKVDVLFVWEVVPGSLDTVTQQAMDAGIKVIAFVQELANYDAAMKSDDAKVALDEVYLASLWTSTALKDLTTINVALITMDNTAVCKTQADAIKANLATIIPTAKIVTTYDVTAESVEAGVTAAENIYTTHPEVNLILTVNASPALGANNYFTGVSSPMTDFTKFGIFTINGSTELHEAIAASGTDKAPLRGTIVTAGIEATIGDMLKLANGTRDGTYKDKFTMYAENLFINASTLDEYKSTGTVTSIKESQFGK